MRSSPSRDRTASFSEIGIHDGTIIVRDAAKDVTERLDGVEFQVAWPSISRSFGANGHFVWHDEPIEASLTLSDFLCGAHRRALGRETAACPARRSSSPSTARRATSRRSRSKARWASKRLAARGHALDRREQAAVRRLRPFRAAGAEQRHGDGVVSLSSVNVELDGNTAEGALTLSTDDHRMVQGTLAADALDLTPYVSGVRLWATNERSWDQLPIALDGLAGFDLDLRLSAASIKIKAARLGRTAVAANMRGGKLDITIGESQAFGGIAKGSIGLASANGGAAVTSHLQFLDVDLENCLGQIFGVHKLDGRGNLALNIDGAGNSVLDVTHTLNGTASLTAHAGALSGINVEQLLRRLERRPLSGNGDFRSGRTPFDQLALSSRSQQGMVSVDDMHIDGPAVRLAVGGQASVPTRDLDLRGVATLVSSATANEFELPFVVQGQWDDPIMLPDPQSLIRHSGAAAPLLEAVKSHSAGDAVRSVIDQLFANPSGAPAAKQAAPADSR